MSEKQEMKCPKCGNTDIGYNDGTGEYYCRGGCDWRDKNLPKEEPQKALPAPEPEKKEEKKRIVLNFSIDVEELYNNIPESKTPENQKLWACQEEMSEEYKEMCGMLEILTFFIARQCNEGPEVKDNINKRLILIRTIFGILMEHLNITGYDCYGLLNEMLHDYYMKISGAGHIMNAISAFQKRKEQETVIKTKDYTS